MSYQGTIDPLIGTRLGTIVLERPLGIGGMGAVYLARQERPRRSVAVKVLQSRLATDPGAWQMFLARFRREADATAALDHANIVPIYEFGEDEDIAYLVMPYLPNGSLAQLLTRERTLSAAATATYVEQAAAALDYAHAHNILHRDVKPSNLLLHPDGRLLLADFGIARLLDAPDPRMPEAPGHSPHGYSLATGDGTLTQVGMAMGTPQYMAPEQIRGEALSPATDIYALANVAYILLTGQTPFDGADTVEILRRQLNEPPMPLRLARPNLPVQMEEVVFWGLAKDPADRPSSAGEFARELRQASQVGTLGTLFSRVAPFRAPIGAPVSMAQQSEETANVARPPVQGTRPLPSALVGGSRTPANPSSYDASRSPTSNPDAPTMFNPAGRYAPGGTPKWPVPDEPRETASSRRGWLWLLPILALILIAVLGVTMVMAHLGDGTSLLGGQSTGSLSPAASRTATAAAQPTATLTPLPTATPSPTVIAQWLSAAPAAVALGCKRGHGESASVVLTNAGPESLKWSTSVPSQAGVTLSTKSGTIGAGHSQTVTLTNTSVLLNHSGTIEFVPSTDNAGQPVAVDYTTQACGVGG